MSVKYTIGVVLKDDPNLVLHYGQSWVRAGVQLLAFNTGKETSEYTSLAAESAKAGGRLRYVADRQGVGLGEARSCLISLFLRTPADVAGDWLLLPDSDVELMQVENFVQAADDLRRKETDNSKFRTGIVVEKQALRDHPVLNGEVLEAASECWLMHRDMLMRLPTFPHDFQYYSTDSWYSYMAYLNGFNISVVDMPDAYKHQRHASHKLPGVTEARDRDTAKWLKAKQGMWERMRHLTLHATKDVSVIPENLAELIGRQATGRVQTLKAVADVPCRVVPQAEFLMVTGPGTFMFTPEHDLKALLSIFSMTGGRILETGCNYGSTTMQLATAFHHREIVAVDTPDTKRTLDEHQKSESPAAGSVCIYARHLSNVRLLQMPVNQLSRSIVGAVSAAFIDDDHTYNGVRAATEKVISLMQDGRGEFHPGLKVIAWHDYAPEHEQHTMPEWLQVGQYVREEIAWRYPTYWLEGTRIAFSILSTI